MEQTNVSQLDTTQLKALAYDQMVQIELCQNNLRAINQELGRRFQSQPPTNDFSQPIEPLPFGSIQQV